MSLVNDNNVLVSLADIAAAQALTLVTAQLLTVSTASVQSAACNASTKRIVISTTQDVWLNIGANPTAAKSAGSIFLAGGAQTYPINVTGGTTKVAALRDAIDGYVTITESA